MKCLQLEWYVLLIKKDIPKDVSFLAACYFYFYCPTSGIRSKCRLCAIVSIKRAAVDIIGRFFILITGRDCV